MTKRVENPKLLDPIGNARVANFKSMVLFLPIVIYSRLSKSLRSDLPEYTVLDKV